MRTADIGTLKRRCFALWRETGLPHVDRHELAEMLLKRDVSSWNDLDPGELWRMVDALSGYQLVSELQRQRSVGPHGPGVAPDCEPGAGDAEQGCRSGARTPPHGSDQ